MGAWIEMFVIIANGITLRVAPHVGAWIEIIGIKHVRRLAKSHPTWVRGLK